MTVIMDIGGFGGICYPLPTMPAPLTLLIPCKNEQANIRDCIESASHLAEEVLLADSGSTDDTLAIARELGCRVIEREYRSSGDFKNWAIPQAKHGWVLILDADERVSPRLAEEIRGILSADGPQDGYWLRRTNYFMGHCIRRSGWSSGRVLRLFRRDLGRYVGDTDHAELEIRTRSTGWLRERLTHYTYDSYDQMLRKYERYTKHQAQIWYEQGRRPNLLKLLLNGPARFFWSYVVRRGFLDGLPGFQVCAMTGFYSFMKQARLWELHHGKGRGDQPEQHSVCSSHQNLPSETGWKAA